MPRLGLLPLPWVEASLRILITQAASTTAAELRKLRTFWFGWTWQVHPVPQSAADVHAWLVLHVGHDPPLLLIWHCCCWKVEVDPLPTSVMPAGSGVETELWVLLCSAMSSFDLSAYHA